MSIDRECLWGFVGLHQSGFDDAGEMNHSGPLSFAMSLPYDVAVKQSSDVRWGEIAVKVEVFRVRGLVASTQVDLIRRWLPFRWEDEGYVVSSGVS
jgi:hypothetical protein